MSLVSFATHSMTISRPARVKDHGSWYDDWDNAEADRTIDGCAIVPGVSAEENGRVDAEQVRFTVLAPPGTDVRSGDRIRVDLEPDLDLAVYGRPRIVASPTGRLDSVYIELSDWRAV
jgi:hypothetical protein